MVTFIAFISWLEHVPVILYPVGLLGSTTWWFYPFRIATQLSSNPQVTLHRLKPLLNLIPMIFVLQVPLLAANIMRCFLFSDWKLLPLVLFFTVGWLFGNVP